MKPTKPREPGSATDAAVRMVNEIGDTVGGDGVKALADFENVSTGLVRKWLDPLEESDISWGRMCRATAHFGVESGAEHLAMLAGGTFLAVRQTDDPRFNELTGAALQHVGQVAREIVEAHSPKSDGGAAFTAREALHLMGPLSDLLSDVSNLIALARAVVDEDVGRRK